MYSLVARYFMVCFFVLGLFSCGKEPDGPDENESPKIFTAIINGEKWSPGYCEVTYDGERHQLHLRASDDRGKYDLHVGISIDSVTPLRKYVLESNGNNVVEVVSGMQQFNTDHNLADAGGVFTLNSLDTINGTFSGSLQFLSYSEDRLNQLSFSADSLNNIPIEKYNLDYDGSRASCTVKGVKTTQWQSNNFFARITCSAIVGSTVLDKSLELHIQSVVGGYPNHRFLLFRIPLNNPKGKYTLYPDAAPYFYCGRLNITSGYSINNIYIPYVLTTGTINITYIDTVMKKMKADFNITYQNKTAPTETIQISNGHIELNGWEG